MTPITKNIIVMNMYGNAIGLTYPKRAKGLIKKGRAVSVDEHTIRLTGIPPSGNTQGGTSMSPKEALHALINEMSDTQVHSLLVMLNTFQIEPSPAVQTIPAPSSPPAAPEDEMLRARSEMMRTLREQIDVLAKDGYSSPNAVDVLKELKDMLNRLLCD